MNYSLRESLARAELDAPDSFGVNAPFLCNKSNIVLVMIEDS